MDVTNNDPIISRRTLASLAWTIAAAGIASGLYLMNSGQILQACTVYLTSFVLAAVLASIADRRHIPPPHDVQVLRQQRAGLIMLVIGAVSALVGVPLALTEPGFLSQFLIAIAPGALVVGWLTYRRARTHRQHGSDHTTPP